MHKFLFAISLSLFLFPMPAYAYIDPGAGSVILQLLLAGIAGIGLFIKLFWKRLTSFFSKTPHHSQGD